MIANEYGTRACTKDSYMTYEKRNLPGYTRGTDTMGFSCPVGFVCAEGENPSNYYSFDNAAISCFTIFQVASLEGWTPMMMRALDGQSSASSIYFVSTIVLFTNFTLQLFTAGDSFTASHTLQPDVYETYLTHTHHTRRSCAE